MYKGRALNILLTLDYELYFGHTPGTAEKCILYPTELLMGITERTGARMTYFIDAGYLVALSNFKENHLELEEDYQRVCDQIKALVKQGNDCQLHIHPHWEDARYENGWQFNVDRYKLADFTKNEVMDIFDRYAEALVKVSEQKIHSYRAGGWCLQPFEKVKDAFVKHAIQIDSTVFPGGYNNAEMYAYDFRNVATNASYRFEDDLCIEKTDGQFLEIPIGAETYSPFFFWQLYGWGRLLPGRHKPIGDGYPIATAGERTNRLTRKSRLPVSLDGYFAKQLNKAVRTNRANDLVVIGHPKACTVYSLEQLEKFIVKQKGVHQFITFSERLAVIDEDVPKNQGNS